jgi:hypothetical protein
MMLAAQVFNGFAIVLALSKLLTTRSELSVAYIYHACSNIPRLQQLFGMVEAMNALSLLFGFGQGRQEHRGENGDDRNYYQKFNEGEGLFGSASDSFRGIGRFLKWHRTFTRSGLC